MHLTKQAQNTLPGESTATGGGAVWGWAVQAAPEPSRVTSVASALAACQQVWVSPHLHALNPPWDEFLDQTLLLSLNVCKNEAF